MPSMAAGGQACQRTGGNALDELAGFRAGWYRCLWQRPDALFETTDAVLTAGPVPSLPYLSLEPVMRRGHGMVYQGLAEGKIDEDAVRDLLVACRPRSWPAVFAIDASTYPRPEAEASPEREFHHHSCAGAHGKDGTVIPGWAFQWLSQLSFAGGSWSGSATTGSCTATRRPASPAGRAGPASTATAATGSSARTPPPGERRTGNCRCTMSGTAR